MRNKKLIMAATALLAVLIALPVFAQHEGIHKREMDHPPMGIPDLTEEQEAQIQSIKTLTGEKILPLQSDIKIKQAELDALLIEENPNQNAINKKIDEIGNLRTRMQKTFITTRLEIRSLLTKEQRVWFDQHGMKRHCPCMMKGHGHDSMGKGMKRFHGSGEMNPHSEGEDE